MPGAKNPAATKMKISGVQSAASGAERIKISHNTAALIVSEISEPVMALDSTRPRRIKMWAMEKNSAA